MHQSNKYSMFYTYKETYFLKYKKVSFKYKLKSFKYQKNILQIQKNKQSRDFWSYFSILLIDPHTNASKLSNKCPVIRTPQQQVALLSQFKAGRTISSPLNLNFLLFYFIQGCNRIYHRHIYIDVSVIAGRYIDVTIILEKAAPPRELSCVITVTYKIQKHTKTI